MNFLPEDRSNLKTALSTQGGEADPLSTLAEVKPKAILNATLPILSGILIEMLLRSSLSLFYFPPY